MTRGKRRKLSPGVMARARIAWVDAAKGLAIILVVVLHAQGLPPALLNYIGTFVVPLFFFLSGHVYSLSRKRGLKSFLLSRTRTLLVPYLTLALFSVLVLALTSTLAKSPVLWSDWLLQVAVAQGNHISANDPLWFLPALFVVEVIYFRLRQGTANSAVLLGVTVVAAVLGYVRFGIIPSLPWSLNVALYYLPFYCAGDLISRQMINKRDLGILAALAGVVIGCAFAFGYPKVIGSLEGYGGRWSLALCGIALTIVLARLLARSRVLQFYGKNSLAVLGLHAPIGFTLARSIERYAHIPQTHGELALLYVSVSLIALVPVIAIVNKAAPFAFGKRYPPERRPQPASA